MTFLRIETYWFNVNRSSNRDRFCQIIDNHLIKCVQPALRVYSAKVPTVSCYVSNLKKDQF